MSEYLPSFLVDPVLRQARRLSRISGADDSPGFLPPVPDLQRWNPSRLWNTNAYPPPSVEEGEEAKESTVLSIARTIQLWTNQINNLDLDPIASRSSYLSDRLPEDDGMRGLRQQINAIWSGTGAPTEKSRQIHGLMMERYRNSQEPNRAEALARSDGLQRMGSPMSVLSAASQDVAFNLSKADLTPTYAPPDPEHVEDNADSNQRAKPELGCVHYQRKVKMQCTACERWYTCRLCHDEVENHTLARRETKYMLCMVCNTPQRAAQTCRMCNQQVAYYYCGICKLWNDDPRKKVYHCDDCGICRLGEGLGKDFFHCKTCAACMSISAEETHKCIERSTKCDCPICGEYMFTSNKAVAFMRCGHSIHESCFGEWCKTSYKCPICSKSIANMESQFRRLDRHIDEQPMPEEYQSTRAYVFCNDCNSRSVAPYHWLGLKCVLCESYNTTQLELLGLQRTAQMQEMQEQQEERAQESGVGEAGMTASQSHTPTEELTLPAGTGESDASGTRAISVPTLSTGLPWLMMPSPTARSARSMSPVVGSYFGTGQTHAVPTTVAPAEVSRREPPLEDDDNLDFWGRQSPTGYHAVDEDWAESEK
ncbi:hypothetical protein DV736_g4220, partial [Chaetothyriales sp. CBS 134916]